MILNFNEPDNLTLLNGGGFDDNRSDDSNSGTLILDATCTPQNIMFPQDVKLLNEVRENLEDMVDYLCTKHVLATRRMYRRNARKDYLNLAKLKNRSAKRFARQSSNSYNTLD